MKTAIRIALIAVVLLSIANTASAVAATTEFDDGCYCVHIEGDYFLSIVPTSSSIPTSPSIVVDARVCKSGDDITVTELKSEPGMITITSLEFSSLCKEQISLTASGTGIYNNAEYPFSGQMTLTPDGESYKTTAYANGVVGQVPVIGQFTATIRECPQEPNPIPEFPTIALPMIAILGLAFMIQRRKE